MAALMPKARTLREFWTNILNGADCISDLPDSRWNRELFYEPFPQARDRTCAYRGGFIPDIDFDPLEFGIPPATLESIDPAQLLSLVVARDALRDAGYPAGGTYDHRATAVILGVVGTAVHGAHQCVARSQIPEWERVLRSYEPDEEKVAAIIESTQGLYPEWTEDSFPGYLPNVVAGRIANRLDLGGMTCTVDAACASSLSAVAHAVAQIEAGHCDLAITGGVDVDNSAAAFISFSKTHALSPSQRLRPFAQGADGTLLAEGIGFLVLKNLARARADGDRIYAAITGIGAASDGRSTSIYAPRLDGQKRALHEAYAAAGVAATSVALVEAHATGTEVGDRVELAALCDVFSGGEGIALGSIKSQVGHAKAAAGAAGLIKAALALHHRVLAPTRLDPDSSYLDLNGSPFCYSTQARPWRAPAANALRRAGVSSFGFGGANYHIVLEEEPGSALPPPAHIRPFPVVVGAPTIPELLAVCAVWSDRLAGTAASAAFRELVRISGDFVPAAAPRLGFVAVDAADAARRLAAGLQILAERGADSPCDWPGGAFRPHSVAGSVVALFPGQGSQYVGMGARLAAGNPALWAAVQAFDEQFAGAGDPALSAVMMPARALDTAGRRSQDQALRRTLYAQAAVGAHSVGLFKMLEAAGLRVDAAAGHSFGEITALWAAGAFNDAAFVDLVRARGEALTPQPGADAGALIAVEASRTQIADFPGVTIANVNAGCQLVLGGSSSDIAAAADRLNASGIAVVRLPVAAAFHTSFVGYGKPPWNQAVASAPMSAPRFPVTSNTTGKLHDAEPHAVARMLARQPFEPVLFERNIEELYAAGGRIFVEIGPRSVLTRLTATILAGREHAAIEVDCGPDSDPERAFAGALIKLRVAGVQLGRLAECDLPALDAVSDSAIRVGGTLVGAERRRGSLDERLASARRERDARQALVQVKESEPPSAVPPPPVKQSSSAMNERLTAWLEIERTIMGSHERFLGYSEEQTRLVLGAAGMPGAGVGALDAIRQQHTDTVRVHEQFLQRIDRIVRHAIDAPDVEGASPTSIVVPTTPAPSAQPPARPEPAAAALPTAAAAAPVDRSPAPAESAKAFPDPLQVVYEIVAAKTGYPASFLRPEMELEGDLGLDSIKRVEVFANLRTVASERYGPGVLAASDVRPESLASARSLGAIADIIARQTRAIVARTAPAGLAPPAAAAALPREDEPKARSNTRVQRLSIVELPPSPSSAAPPQTGATVLLSDGGPLTAELVRMLDERGRCVVVFHPAATAEDQRLADQFDQFVLADDDRAALGIAFDTATRLRGSIASIIVLQPYSTVRRGDPTQRARLRLALLCAAEGAPRLAASEHPAFSFVARMDGRFGTTGTAAAEAAALAGLARTLRCELPQIDARLLDVDAHLPPATAAAAIVREIEHEGAPPVVGLGAHGRVGLEAAPLLLAPAESTADLEGGLIVATGGARGVTFDCVEALGRRTGARFLILARTPVDEPEPDWAIGCAPERLRAAAVTAGGPHADPRGIEMHVRAIVATREVRSSLARLTAAGVEAHYAAVDVADRGALATVLARAVAELGPISGIIHGAGAVSDRRLTEKTIADFEAVFAPKVDGLFHLLDAVDPDSLRCVALFSSVAGVYGNVGQADYAMANCLLDATAAQLALELPRARVISIAWGPWDGGMVTPALREHFTARGVTLLERNQGAALFVDAVLGRSVNPPILIVGDDVDRAAADGRVSQRGLVAGLQHG